MRLVLLAVVACALAAPPSIEASVHPGGGAPGRAGSPSAPLRVWPLGDSITLGASWPNPAPGGYRTALDQVLARDGVAHKFVGTSALNSSPSLDVDGQAWHDGHGGYRIDQAMADLDGEAHGPTDDGGHWLTGVRARRGLSPDVVLIHLGTNDIVQTWDTRRFPTRDGRADLANARQRAQFVADMTQRLAALIARVHTLRPQCRIILATIVPLAIPKFTSVVSAYAVSVRRLVAQLRARRILAALADIYAAFTVPGAPGQPIGPGLISYDNIHPTAAGYALMARTFANAIES